MQDLHVPSRVLVAQLDRALEELFAAAPAGRAAMTIHGHESQRFIGVGEVLSCALLEPRLRLLCLYMGCVALLHEIRAKLKLAIGAAPLSTDPVRRHRPLVVGRHALAQRVDVSDELSSLDVALREECRTNE